jgi:hypothetical protein
LKTGSIIRSYVTPLELHEQIEEEAKKTNTSLNSIHNEGFKLWLKQAKKKVKKIEV